MTMRDLINLLCEAETPPTILYHRTSAERRPSIAILGLRMDHAEAGGIYFSDLFEPQPGFDIWALDPRGIADLEHDFVQPDDGSTWWVTYEDVPSERLRLIA